MLARAGDRRRLVMSIDDVQWSDTDSAHLFKELLKHPDPPRLLLVLTSRSDALDHCAMLAAMPERTELALEPLPPEAVRELASALVAGDPARTEAIVRESRGVPFFIHQLAVAEEANVSQMIARRLAELPPVAKEIALAEVDQQIRARGIRDPERITAFFAPAHDFS
jgi:hypothetical protein